MCAAASHVSLVRCDPAADKKALALATEAWPEAERAAYQQTLESLLGAGQSACVVLLSAREHDRLIAAQLAQVLPGKAAVVWPPRFVGSGDAQAAISGPLFDRLAAELVQAGAHIAQSLLPNSDKHAAGLFSSGGFYHAADLLYLAANLNELRDAQRSSMLEVDAFKAGDEPRLAALIDRTYVGTLDCPGLDGLRQTADVIEGYQAVGEFHPELWLIARHRAQDVGCLLMNLHPDVRHAEIVYIALIPEVRGRGWGSELVKKSIELARRASAERIVLAVDAANKPAIAMYQALGFFEFDRRAVWIRPLGANPK